jgi:hypothetical protein
MADVRPTLLFQNMHGSREIFIHTVFLIPIAAPFD